MKMTINIDMLERILENARAARKANDSLSTTIEFEQKDTSDTHLGSDFIAATLKNSYAECDGVLLFNHWK